MELLVDKVDADNSEDIYYLAPDRLNQLKLVTPNSFSKATIRNCPVQNLTPFTLQCLFHGLQKGASATIIIDEPVLVLQDYDADTIAANAELAGFRTINPGNTKAMCERLGTTVETITITLTK